VIRDHFAEGGKPIHVSKCASETPNVMRMQQYKNMAFYMAKE